MKSVFIFNLFSLASLSSSAIFQNKKTQVEMNYVASSNDRCSSFNYLGFEFPATGEYYTLEVTNPDDCNSRILKSSVSGTEFVEEVLNTTQEIESTCNVTNSTKDVKPYTNTVWQEFPLETYDGGPDGGDTRTDCYSIRFSSKNKVVNSDRLDCITFILYKPINKFKSLYNGCELKKYGSIAIGTLSPCLLAYALYALYKNYTRISNSVSNCLERARLFNQPRTRRGSGPSINTELTGTQSASESRHRLLSPTPAGGSFT